MSFDYSTVGPYRLRYDFVPALFPESRFHGLGWRRDIWGSEPRWITEPSEKDIGEVMEVTFSDRVNRVTLFHLGQCHALFSVRASTGGDYIARLALPIDPGFKTVSEVATIDWVSQRTSLPTPRILGFHANNQNAIGFEWIAMADVPGEPLGDMWYAMSWAAKVDLVIRLAGFAVETFGSNEFDQIGSLTFGPARETPAGMHTGLTEVGRVMSPEFGWDEEGAHVHCRGPFNNSRQWMAARLKAAEDHAMQRLYRVSPLDEDDHEQTGARVELTVEQLRAMAQSDEDNDILFDDFDSTFYILAKLKRWFDLFFPYGPGSWPGAIPDPKMLLHHKMDFTHVLVEPDGTLAAVVDWQDIGVVPKWMGCRYPSFLRGRDRDREPKMGEYQSIGPDSLYCEHKRQHELTQLRRVFMNAVYSLEPDWVRMWQRSVPQRDFDLAVRYCHDPKLKGEILAWLDDLDQVRSEVDLRGLEWRLMKYPDLP